MRILWISNIQFPAICRRLGILSHISGGWMISLAEKLNGTPGIDLSICTTYDGQDLLIVCEDGITYYLLPRKKNNTHYDKSLEKHWKKVINDFKPDLVHIHGTEYVHGLSCLNSCQQLKYVISLQGLLNASSEFYFAGIHPKDVFRHITLHDILKKDSLFHQMKKFKRRSKFEKEYFKRITHIIGRTDWDSAHAHYNNPNIKYHYCHEALRGRFYSEKKWNLEEKQDFTIFLSQAGYPLKGLHQALKALAIVKESFPNAHMRVAGHDITGEAGFKNKLRISGYGFYVKTLIKKLNLLDNITFTGPLDEEEMINEFRRAHVFVCPSSIENSSNSVAEAQLLGVPCIASFVGGLPSMIKHRETGLLYRFEDYVMLASYIMEIFKNDHLALDISNMSRRIAMERHDRTKISTRIIEIYSEIINDTLT